MRSGGQLLVITRLLPAFSGEFADVMGLAIESGLATVLGVERSLTWGARPLGVL